MTMLTQGDRHFALRLVLYDEDATLGPRIAAAVEDDPRWELIALCTTLGDLNFVLNRVTVDVLLLHLTPESAGRVLSAASALARNARLLVLFQSGVSRQNRAPNDLLVADRGFQFLWRGREGELWALLPLVPPAGRPAAQPRTSWERKHIAGLTASNRVTKAASATQWPDRAFQQRPPGFALRVSLELN